MRILPLALALATLTACPVKDDTAAPPEADTDTDTDADSDTDADADSDTDADTDVGVEDCEDGADNDGDGLIDCEDDDCVDACMEDCEDGVDNDADGLVDCDDDECTGDSACTPVPYDLSLVSELEGIVLETGYIYETMMGYAGLSRLYGYVDLVGTPQGPHGTGFRCTGNAQSYPALYTDHGFGSSYHYGYTKGAGDYVFEFTLHAPDNLQWYGDSCPVSTLPVLLLGMTHTDPEITRYDEAAGWQVQYTSAASDMTIRSGQFYRTTYWRDPSQSYPVEWTGYYTP